MAFPKYILLISLIAISCFHCVAADNGVNGGLGFHSNSYNISDRTSYNVFDNGQDLPKKRLDIHFELSLVNGSNIGYILTCKDSSTEIFNLSAKEVGTEADINLNLNLTFIGKKLTITIPKSECSKNIWHKTNILISPATGIVRMSVGGKSRSIEFDRKDLPTGKARYVFGKCDHYVDVFSIAIRNLQWNRDGKSYIFPLSEISGESVSSSAGKATGSVSNPDWLLTRHYNWEHVSSIGADEIAAFFQDMDKHRIIAYTSRQQIIYDMAAGELSFKKHDPEKEFRIMKGGGFNCAHIDKTGKTIIFNCAPDSGKKPSIIEYDHESCSITRESYSNLTIRRHHNSTFSDKDGTMLYLFGGYGAFSYINTFNSLDLNTLSWSEAVFTGDTIAPRFYTSISSTHDGEGKHVWLYGGYGNISGRQDDGARYFHDLYQIDIDSRSVRKIHDFSLDGFDLVPSRNMIMGKDGHSFYTMCYPQYKPESHLQLYRFDWKDGTCTAVSDSISFISQKISTQVHLFADDIVGEMLCIVQEFTSRDNSTINIYRISMPLLNSAAIMKNNGKRQIMPILPVLVIILVLCTIVIIRYKRKKISLPAKQQDSSISPTISADTGSPLNDEEQPAVIAKANMICLLGDFSAFNRNGRDITYLFSPKIRSLFLLILLYSLQDRHKGISPNEISAILWPEKDLKASQNTRGVTLNKLKDILSEIDGISISRNGGKLTIEIDRDICNIDYIDAISPDTTLWNTGDYDTIRPYIRLLRRGTLLRSEADSWTDPFKSEYEETILNICTPVMKTAYECSDFLTSYKLSQILLSINPLNEDILRTEINSLVGLKDPVKAKMKFRQFSLLYYEVYGKNLNYEDFI